jgi:uncharacterized protein YpmB
MMKMWKIWLVSATAVATLGVVALACAVWNNLSSEWNVEATAAQFALDKSPINHIDSHDIFTASGAQEVFGGSDVFGRKWYAFVYGSPFTVKYVASDGILTQEQIISSAMKVHLKPLKEQIGYLDSYAQSTFHTDADVIWEVYAKNASGQSVYVYFDARSGNTLT